MLAPLAALILFIAALISLFLFIVALTFLLIVALFAFLTYTDTGGPFTTHYKNARCENTVFATDEETILLDNLKLWNLGVISTMSLKSSQRYAFDRGSPPHRQQEIRIYPAGSRVKTLGFYKTGDSRVFVGHISSYYYLQSLEDNRTFWLPISEYDVQRCRADFRREVDRRYYPEGTDIEKVSIDITTKHPKKRFYGPLRLDKMRKNIRAAHHLRRLHEAVSRFASGGSAEMLKIDVPDARFLFLAARILERYVDEAQRQRYGAELVTKSNATDFTLSPTFSIYAQGRLVDSFSPVDCKAYRDTLDLYACFDDGTFATWLTSGGDGGGQKCVALAARRSLHHFHAGQSAARLYGDQFSRDVRL